MTNLVLIAKETLPGKVKTRLHPPLSLEQAAELAAVSISDTLRGTAHLPTTGRILAFDGDPAHVPAGAENFFLLPQVDGTLDLRLGAIFDFCQGPTLLIGMDTPQITAADLAPAFEAWPDDIDAWFGPASDGGFWALGLKNPTGDLLRGIPMSQSDTGRHQLKRLMDAGLRVGMLPELTDVDTIENAFDVAAIAPHSEFARTLERFRVTESSLV
jgi:glycosyltransferase A (GT-A) superfamily protein (DUF2064 family)